MRKLIAAAAVLSVAGVAGAVEGDFTLSGHVTTGAAFAKYTNKAASVTAGASGATYGVTGELTNNTSRGGSTVTAGSYEMLFFVDEAELDLTKEFSENVAARVDLSFGRLASGSGAAGATLEQAYTTLNIPVGNGVEFLIGRFDAPMGFESVERHNNNLFSHTAIWRELVPSSFTGVKFYVPFTDMVDMHFYLVNNLRDDISNVANNDQILPAFGTRVGFNWGDEGKKSTVGLSAAYSLESKLATSDKYGEASWVADLDWNVWFNESIAFGGEGVIRMDNAAGGAKDALYFGGQANLHYVFNDQWDGTVRYAFVTDRASHAASINGGNSLLSGAGTGTKTQAHELSAGVQYHVTEAAKMQLEANYALIKQTALAKGQTFGAVVGFSYNF